MDIENLFKEVEETPKFAIKELFDKKNIEMKTDLSEKEIFNIAKVVFLADYLKSNSLKNWIYFLLKLKVSKDRKGRQEIVKILKDSDEVNTRKIIDDIRRGIL